MTRNGSDLEDMTVMFLMTVDKKLNFANKNELRSGFFSRASREEFSVADTWILALSREPHHAIPAF